MSLPPVVRHLRDVVVGSANRFVGRAVEMAGLTALLDDAGRGDGRFVIISGEGGIGKARLCEEFTATAQARGVGVAWAACWEALGVPPFAPWRSLLEQLGAGSPAVGDDSSDGAARAALFAAVSDTMRRLAVERPRLLVIDDVHWADTPTVRLLAHIAPTVRTMPLLLVVTLRDGNRATTSLREALAHHGHSMPLGGLSLDDLRELMADVSGWRQGSPLVATVHGTTAGNPLFVGELARRLHRDGAGDNRAALLPLPIPPTVRSVLDERLAEVDAPCREVLEVAAVVGQQFSLPLIGHVLGRGPDDLFTEIDEAHQAGIVTVRGSAESRVHPPSISQRALRRHWSRSPGGSPPSGRRRPRAQGRGTQRRRSGGAVAPLPHGRRDRHCGQGRRLLGPGSSRGDGGARL